MVRGKYSSHHRVNRGLMHPYARSDADAVLDKVPNAAYESRKTWPAALNVYSKAFQEGELRVTPLSGSKFDK